jgi:hypothetical protein
VAFFSSFGTTIGDAGGFGSEELLLDRSRYFVLGFVSKEKGKKPTRVT